MATIREATISQSSNETVRIWTADFTDDLPSGGTVTAGTAFHIPPGGAAGTITPTITVSSPFVSAMLSGAITDYGVHYIDIVGTFDNTEKSNVRVAFPVVYDSTQARSGMTALIRRLRMMAMAGAVDFEIAGVPYWSDAQLQEVLDNNRVDFYEQELQPIPKTVASQHVYLRYDGPHGNMETIASGTAIWNLTTSDGTQAGTAAYSVDYTKGIVTFTADQGGTAWFMSGRSYDLNASAADVWATKASYYQQSYDVKTDGHELSRSQLLKQANEREAYYRAQVGAYTVDILRGDE
jgi:hypothetical protein